MIDSLEVANMAVPGIALYHSEILHVLAFKYLYSIVTDCKVL